MTEPILQLTPSDSAPRDEVVRTAIQEAILQDLKTEEWKQIEAAIFIAGTTYLYKRRVENNPQHFTYKCLSPEALQRAFRIERIDSGWLPPNILRCGSNTQGDWAVLFIPPAKTAIELIQDAERSTLLVPLPGLVLAGQHQTYWLWATADPTFHHDGMVYHAPLPNVHNSGRVCWGTNQPPIATPQGIVQAWNLFITSPFANHLVQGKSRQYSTNICQQLQSLHRKRRGTYPLKDLVTKQSHYRPLTFTDLIEDLIHA